MLRAKLVDTGVGLGVGDGVGLVGLGVGLGVGTGVGRGGRAQSVAKREPSGSAPHVDEPVREGLTSLYP